MANDTADAVLYIVDGSQAWAYMCAHCDKTVTYEAREEAYAWHKVVEHLQLVHGIRRTWVEVLDDRIANARQMAFPLILNHLAGRNQRGI